MGARSISEFLSAHQTLFQLAGGTVLMVVGTAIFLSPSSREPEYRLSSGLPAAFGSTFLMSMANPSYLLVFTFVFAMLGIKDPQEGCGSTMALTAGICCGSVSWPLFIAAATKRFRIELRRNVLTAVNRICGGVLAGLGALGAILSLAG
jgi:threonine/homoserine/homoserine lactone efflux protein